MMKPLRIKHPTLPRAPRTEAQKAASERNFHTMRIRALWTLSCILSKPRREAVQAIIDQELTERGVEPHGLRVERERADLYERLAVRRETEIPF